MFVITYNKAQVTHNKTYFLELSYVRPSAGHCNTVTHGFCIPTYLRYSEEGKMFHQ